MKLKAFLSFLTLINVYFLYVCQPVLADAYYGKSCVSLFNEESKANLPPRTLSLFELSKLHEENVYAVHITKFIPSSGFIKAVVKDRGRFIPTIHFSLGEPVVDHYAGKWAEKPYAIVTPLKSLRDQVLNLLPQDTYILGDFKIPKEAVLFIPRGEAVPQGLNFRIIQYDSGIGIKSAISKFLRESGSIEFKSEPVAWGTKNTKFGKMDLLKSRNLEKFFLQLFKDKQFLTKTDHSETVWGKTDAQVIFYLVKWILGTGTPQRSEGNLNLVVYALRDNILEMNRIVSQMNLPDYALATYKESLRELESYINIFEIEEVVRKSGHSLLAVTPSKDNPIYSQALLLRYDRKKLFDLILSVQEQLPAPSFEIAAARATSYSYLNNYSMEEFLSILHENFPHPDKETEHQLREAITTRALRLLLKGKITAEQAFPYFRKNAEELSESYFIMKGFGDNILYALAGEANSLSGKKYKINFPHRELLRFLKNPWVNQLLESKGVFKYFSPESKKIYLEKINSVDDFATPSSLTNFTVVGNNGPRGDLISVGKVGAGFTKGVWHLDENNILWFIKKDVHYNELQTSAEVISSNIYRFFGYDTPETVKLIKNGVHYAAVKNAGENHIETDFTDMNTSKVRQMRVIAAYLKDWDRLANPNNNLLKSDGNFTLLDFGGTLGARARGMHKPGSIFSDAIGNFEATENIDVIFGSYNVQASAKHPWNNLTRTDFQEIIEKFRQLTDAKIESIVDEAGYSNPADRNYMVQALKMRRNGIINNMFK
jgi:hypothetical protein